MTHRSYLRIQSQQTIPLLAGFDLKVYHLVLLPGNLGLEIEVNKLSSATPSGLLEKFYVELSNKREITSERPRLQDLEPVSTHRSAYADKR